VKSILAFGVVALALTACGDNGSAAPSPVTEVVATSPTPTTVVEPAPTTTQPIPTTTLPPTTTTVPTEDLIKQAVKDYTEAYHQCGVDPAACVPDTFTAAQGHSRAVMTDFVSGLVREGLHFSTDARGSRVVAESAAMDSSTTASAVFCVFDAGTVLGPIGPDNLPTVVNDEVASMRYEFVLFLEDDAWRVGEKHELERLSDGDSCPAE